MELPHPSPRPESHLNMLFQCGRGIKSLILSAIYSFLLVLVPINIIQTQRSQYSGITMIEIKGGICIPNSTTGDLTVNDVDLFQRSNVTA